jgi:hypothetical protein
MSVPQDPTVAPTGDGRASAGREDFGLLFADASLTRLALVHDRPRS